jgi:Fe-S oxidoreductase
MALEDYRENMGRCSRCSYCKFIPQDQIKSWRFQNGCPSIAYNNFHTYSAGGRLAAALALVDKRIEYSDKFADIVYNCLTCGSCDVACKICRYDVEPLDVMLELRARLVEDGQILPQNMPVIDNLKKEDTMILGKLKSDRGKWAEGLDVKDLTKESAEVVFHAGCNLSYDEALWEVSRTAITILRKAGVDIGIMGKDENCCGGRAYSLGYRGEFTKYAENNIQAWTTARVKTVVTACADGYWAMKRLYPEVGSRFEVLHVVELLARLIKAGKLKLKKSVPMTITYHDPCHLGRQGESYVPWNGKKKTILGQLTINDPPKPRYNGAWGIYEPPREILQSIPGLKLVEMERIREYSWCCGAGGGAKDAYPDFSLWTATERIEEAKATGSEAIVTACPWCKSNFTNAINTMGEKIKVLDIIELVQQSL